MLVLTIVAQATQDPTVSDALGGLQTVLQYAGTVAFGISGALVAGQKRMDLAGVVVLGSIVAVGGGTIRDLLLNLEVFWVNDATYVLVGAAAALLTVPMVNTRTAQALQRYRLVDLFDAAGMAIFVITGTTIALSSGAGWLSAAIIGVISGVGGGMLRDILAMQVPGVLKNGRLYATAALAGALLYVALLQIPVAPTLALWLPALAIFSVRMLSLHFGWGLPHFDTTRK